MAECEVCKTIEVALTLTPNEALYLRNVLQNYYGPEGTEESPSNTQTRANIFNVLPVASEFDDDY